MTVRETTCKSALTKTGGFLAEYTHSLQPYVGCVFQCAYCYVQALPIHQYHGGEWGEYVDVKVNAPDVLLRELAALRARGKPVRVFMSSATDPYQGAEAKYHITRRCLEAFIAHQPDLLVVQTRSPVVRRDFDLLAQIDRCVLSLTLETNDETVRRTLTPRCPSIRHRVETLDAAMAAGLAVQVAVSPVLPNDPAAFARLLAGRCHRVVVDTYFAGDGSCGSRTERLGIRALYTRHGYDDWYHPDAYRRLYETLIDAFGSDRVGFSKEGFNTIGTIGR
ncbi:MAG: radical SAM protein [Candidatus Latescibacteria bacterium]|nr:radical SAM protein [Candidatus Latescibacterota bacterium]